MVRYIRTKWRESGIFAMLVACFFFSMMGVCVKSLSATLPAIHIVFYRSFFSALMILPFMRLMPIQSEWKTFALLSVRSLVGTAGVFCIFYSIAHLPLTTSTTLTYTAPIFTAIISPFLLHERFSRLHVLILILCFCGMLLIIKPATTTALVPSLVGLASGVFAALVHIMIRRLRTRLPSGIIVLGFLSGAAIFSFPFFIMHPIWPTNLKQCVLIIAMGVTSTVAQVSMTHSYRMDTASRLSAVTYFTVLFAAFWDLVVWHHRPDFSTMCGALLIVFGGLLLTLHHQPKEDIRIPGET